MLTRAPRLLPAVVTGIAVACGVPLAASARPAGPAVAARAPAWARLGAAFNFADEAGILRLPSGRLHLVWRQGQANHMFRYVAATISAGGRILSRGTALANWSTLESDPRLIPGGPAIRLVFIGGRTGSLSDFFSRGAVYTEVSNGSTWTLVHASMSKHTVLNLGLAAVARSDKTPVATFGLNNVLYFHTGLDPNAPASAPDGIAGTGPPATGLENAALVRAKDGTIWVAWYEIFGPHPGYFVRRILPTAGPVLRAPGSGGSGKADNEPRQQVAFVSRARGGLYLAYCSPTKTVQCAHIDLWRVGSRKPLVVPRSGTGQAGHVALSVAPRGRLWLAWFDAGSSLIRTVQTSTSASRFGTVHAVRQPRPAFIFNGLQAEGSAGRLDLVVNILVLKPSAHEELWHLQVG